MKKSGISTGGYKNVGSSPPQKDSELIKNYSGILPPINKKSSFKAQMGREDESRDVIVTYIEEKNGKYYKRRLNLQSPRTKEAADYLGVTFEDCIIG